jgi:hypothetical protein
MYHPDKPRAEKWARATATSPGRPVIAFIQEIPSEGWLQQWREAGYRVIVGVERGWKVRSAILTTLPDDACIALGEGDLPELRYHGEYVAAARLKGWSPQGDLTLLSVHAQPAATTHEYLRHYPDSDAVHRRDGGNDPRWRGQLFDADVVIETISRAGPLVLACGDLNEARGWDDVPGHEGHTWGTELFGSSSGTSPATHGVLHEKGLVDIPLTVTGEEAVTRRAPGHPSLQLDHIVAPRELAQHVRDGSLDKAWTEPVLGVQTGLADHAPIWFTLSKGGGDHGPAERATLLPND